MTTIARCRLGACGCIWSLTLSVAAFIHGDGIFGIFAALMNLGIAFGYVFWLGQEPQVSLLGLDAITHRTRFEHPPSQGPDIGGLMDPQTVMAIVIRECRKPHPDFLYNQNLQAGAIGIHESGRLVFKDRQAADTIVHLVRYTETPSIPTSSPFLESSTTMPKRARKTQTELPPAVNVVDVETFRDKFKWQRVQLPKVWHPQNPGEELLGYFGGRTLRTGKFGQYEVALIHTLIGPFTVSGTEIIQLLDAANIERGHAVRIMWSGTEELPGDRTKKRFELLIATQFEKLSEDELPKVRVA